MYNTQVFETAINENGYIIEGIKYTNRSREVRKIDGRVPVVKYINIDGEKRKKVINKPVRWDAFGNCFGRFNNKRLRKWDVDVKSAFERLNNCN